jgi:hypothetical protein
VPENKYLTNFITGFVKYVFGRGGLNKEVMNGCADKTVTYTRLIRSRDMLGSGEKSCVEEHSKTFVLCLPMPGLGPLLAEYSHGHSSSRLF